MFCFVFKRKKNNLEGKYNNESHKIIKTNGKPRKLTASNIMVQWEVNKAGNRTQDKIYRKKKKKKIKDKIKFKYNLNKWNPNNGFSARGQNYLITIPGLVVRKRQIYIFDKIFFIPIITIPKEYAKQQILNKDFISTKSDNSHVLILKSQTRISSIYVIISSKFWST